MAKRKRPDEAIVYTTDHGRMCPDCGHAKSACTCGRPARPKGDGIVRTEVLEMTGGSDLSEQFDIASDSVPATPGMLVCIDPLHPGRLALSSGAYNRTVAGVISGTS